ncbi:aminotransferase class IV [Methylobacterium dankookense]|uniref:Probable branched-chain-amino-acid aminotransferase n=1 Tax=Methylobacterium dankookense TaxID=560405 RepID=A0A564FWV0_9HYPH|nr:aminotransferase class IV [Methylobacterium dankookense]GJD57714.1 Aminodeoxychorismate lyase [Methylobacterium dankookense]VUF12344.1 Aminodeoxychorismate lyase [Methylobacterium dankookense]
MLWRDGSLQTGTHAPFDLTDRGLCLGDGLFDTALALDGRVAFEDAHVARLVAGAESLGFRLDPATARTAMRALAATGPRLAIRTTATRGSGPRGLRPPAEPCPVLYATAAASSAALAFAPLSLWPTQIARNETSPAARLKTLGYLDAVLAARDAAASGFDEALFCNTRGHVACAGTGNLFGIFADRLVTPPLADGVLAGIVRAEILGLAPRLGLRVEERSLPLDAFLRADAVFLTNSLRLLAPVRAVGTTPFASVDHPGLGRLIDALRTRVAESCGVAEPAVA